MFERLSGLEQLQVTAFVGLAAVRYGKPPQLQMPDEAGDQQTKGMATIGQVAIGADQVKTQFRIWHILVRLNYGQKPTN